jgi:hypothetical protein
VLVNEVYEDVAKYLEMMSEAISKIVGKHDIKLFEAVFSYSDEEKILQNASEYARIRLNIFGEQLDKDNLNIEQANIVTRNINSKTKDVKEAKLFLDNDFYKISRVLSNYQRIVLKEYIEEYRLKIETIYNLLFLYKKDNKKNDLILPDRF